MERDKSGAVTFAIERDLLDMHVLTNALLVLEESLKAGLEEVGVRSTVPAAMGSDVHNRLNDSSYCDNASDKEISFLRGQFPPEVRMRPEILAVAQAIAATHLADRVYGTNARFVHLPPMARFVLPGNSGAGVPPHSDMQYNLHMSKFFTVWVPLVDIDNSCGGVRIFRPSADGLPEPQGMASSGTVRQWHAAIDVDGYEPVDCVPMGPGSCLTFSPSVLHESMANTSSRIRYSLDLRFLPEGASSTKPVLDLYTGQVHPNTISASSESQ